MSRHLLTHLATPQSLPRRPSVTHPAGPAVTHAPGNPVRTLAVHHPPVSHPSPASHSALCFDPPLDSPEELFSPSPTPSNLRGPPSFPSTPSSHRCEGVDGKVGGAVRAVAETGRARAYGRELPENRRLNALRIVPGKRPNNAPDPGAHCGAYCRAHWRATSRPQRAVPQLIAGSAFWPSSAWSSVGNFPASTPRTLPSPRDCDGDPD